MNFQENKKQSWMRVISGVKHLKSPSLTMRDFAGYWCSFYTTAFDTPIEAILNPDGVKNPHISRNKINKGAVVVARVGDYVYLLRADTDRFMIIDSMQRDEGAVRNYVVEWTPVITELVTSGLRIELSKPRKPVRLVNSSYKAVGVLYTKTNTLMVLSGSEVSKKIGNAKFKFYSTDVQKLLKSGLLSAHPTQTDRWILRKEFTFKSPSAAATICTGSSANGKDYWK